jgi:hypothetical protein
LPQGTIPDVNVPSAPAGVQPGLIAFTSRHVPAPSQPLLPGEYGFIQALSGGNVSGGGGALTARVFDFSIPG